MWFNYINLRLQEVTRSIEPFEGINIFCIGDLFQLQPMMDISIFQFSSSGLNALAPNILIDHTKMFEITEIMRQAGDRRFAVALNNIREGKHKTSDADLFFTCVRQSNDDSNYPVHATHMLYCSIGVVEAHNTSLFDKSSAEKVVHRSTDIVVGDVSDDLKLMII